VLTFSCRQYKFVDALPLPLPLFLLLLILLMNRWWCRLYLFVVI